MPLLTAKSSTIFICTGGDTRIYHSVCDVPVPLRRRLEKTTQGQNSATILIADKRGREELVRALQGEPSSVQCRLADAIRTRKSESLHRERRRNSLRSIKRWLEFLVPIALGGSLWFLIESRF